MIAIKKLWLKLMMSTAFCLYHYIYKINISFERIKSKEGGQSTSLYNFTFKTNLLRRSVVSNTDFDIKSFKDMDWDQITLKYKDYNRLYPFIDLTFILKDISKIRLRAFGNTNSKHVESLFKFSDPNPGFKAKVVDDSGNENFEFTSLEGFFKFHNDDDEVQMNYIKNTNSSRNIKEKTIIFSTFSEDFIVPLFVRAKPDEWSGIKYRGTNFFGSPEILKGSELKLDNKDTIFVILTSLPWVNSLKFNFNIMNEKNLEIQKIAYLKDSFDFLNSSNKNIKESVFSISKIPQNKDSLLKICTVFKEINNQENIIKSRIVIPLGLTEPVSTDSSICFNIAMRKEGDKSCAIFNTSEIKLPNLEILSLDKLFNESKTDILSTIKDSFYTKNWKSSFLASVEDDKIYLSLFDGLPIKSHRIAFAIKNDFDFADDFTSAENQELKESVKDFKKIVNSLKKRLNRLC
jgi:hypothetical protein